MRGLRTRLIAILLVALVPAVLLFVWYANAQRSASESRLREDQIRRVQLRAQTVEQMLVDVRSELVAVSANADAQRGDWPAVTKLLRDISRQDAAYAHMGAADASGLVRGSSTDTSRTISVADREWFQRVVRTGRPAIGRFEPDPFTGAPSIPVAVPVGDPRQGAAVLFSSLPIDVIRTRLAEVRTPGGTVLVLIDDEGHLLVRLPDLSRHKVGERETADIVQSALRGRSGSVRGRGLDGTLRRWEYRQVAVDPVAPLEMIVGYDERVVFAPERRQLLTGLGILAVVALAEIGLAYAGASRWVLRPVRRLNEASAAVASGDLSAHVGDMGGSQEFRSLGLQFDAMTASLEERLRELRESQAALDAERGRLRATVDYLPLGVALLAPDGAVLELNPANERIWEGGPKPGTLEEYREYHVFDIETGERIEPQDLPGPRALAEQKPVVGRLYAFERFDGTRGFIQISAIPFFGTSGELAGAVVTTEDVTGRVRRQRLSDALNRIDAVAHSSLDVSQIMQRSLDAGCEALQIAVGTIELCEEGTWVVRYQHGLSPSDVGRELTEEEAPNAAEMSRTRAPLAIADMAGDPVRFRGFVKEHGERSVLGAPLIVRDGVVGCLLFYERQPREFTEIEIDFVRRLAASVSLALDNATLYAELEERVQRRTAELETANKELEAFSYSVSHDLRAPLRSIDGFSRALEEDYGDRLDPDAGDYLERIRAGANKMADLIDALLTLSRLTRAEMRFEKVDLSAMVREVAGELRQHEPDRCVDLEVSPALTAKGDPALLRVLLTNLIANAWKFTAGRECGRIEVGRRAVDGEQAFFVRDNGVGFDMAYSNKLFTAFQRLHAQGDYPGIGIGLTIAARVVHRHGGRIWAQAEPGKGATFYFTLP